MAFLVLTNQEYLGLNHFVHHVICYGYMYNSNFSGFNKCQE